MWPNSQETADLVPFTEEILNEELHFLCSADDTIVKLMISFISGVSLWKRPCYENMLNYDNNSKW